MLAAGQFGFTDDIVAGDRSNILSIAQAWARRGVPVIWIEGGAKYPPIDMRTPAQRKVDDEAAQAEGRSRSRGGVHTATTDAKAIERAYNEYMESRASAGDLAQYPNLGLALAGKDLIIVDADTAEAVEHLLRLYADWTGGDSLPTPTETTPGVQTTDGGWVHRGGGHWYFWVEDGLPEGARGLSLGTGAEQVSILTGPKYVVTAPSMRAEGSYEWTGGVYDAPAALVGLVAERAAKDTPTTPKISPESVEAKVVEAEIVEDDPIDRWARQYAWETVLPAYGWTSTGLSDSCGCPIYTAPGTHASAKSATAHQCGCSEYDTSCGHAPLHVWTDNPPNEIAAWIDKTGSRTLSMVQFAAAMEHRGDVAALLHSVDIPLPDDPNWAAAPGQKLAGGLVPAATHSVPAPATTDELVVAEDDTAPDNDEIYQRVVSEAEAELGRTLDESEARRLSNRVAKGQNPYDTALYPRGYHSDLALMRKIMNFSDQTRAVHRASRAGARTAHPVTALVAELLRIGRRAPVDLRTPTGEPLSTYLVAVGKSGSGKTHTLRGCIAWSTINPFWDSCHMITHDELDATRSPGSGEALTEMFLDTVESEDETGKVRKEKVMKYHPSVTLYTDEIAGLVSASGRDGATTASTLTSAWSEAPIGADTKKDGATRVEGHYSLFLKGGLQTKKASGFLALADLGLVQRTLLLPATSLWSCVDLGIPDPGEVPAPHLTISAGNGMTACDAVFAALDDAEDVSSVDSADEDDLFSHLLAVRIRLASLAAIMHSSLHVDEHLWEWSGWVIDMHKRTLAWAQAACAKAEAEEAHRQGRLYAHRKNGEITEAHDLLGQTASRVLGLVQRAGDEGTTRGRIKANLAAGKKIYLQPAIDQLLRNGQISQDGSRYKAV